MGGWGFSGWDERQKGVYVKNGQRFGRTLHLNQEQRRPRLTVADCRPCWLYICYDVGVYSVMIEVHAVLLSCFKSPDVLKVLPA